MMLRAVRFTLGLMIVLAVVEVAMILVVKLL